MIELLKGECCEDISTKIIDFYNSKGLDYQEPLGLILGEEDKSVTFMSAAINNFKKYPISQIQQKHKKLKIMLLYTKN
jgi:alanyl-tRNA synthetase